MNKIISLFFLLFIGNSSFADTFIVTTNADNGIGSLRDAIQKANANGSAITDNIHFNIPDNSIAGRTIILLSTYPDLTSKIIIDGSTQPGAFIGVSHAKIRITNPTGVGVECVFRIINNNNVEIYGFHFDKLNIVGGTYMSRAAILLNTT